MGKYLLFILILWGCLKSEMKPCKKLGWELRSYENWKVVSIDTTFFGIECDFKYDTTIKEICFNGNQGRWVYY